jgi:hypothetical protein
MNQQKVPFRLIGVSTEQFAVIEENYVEEGDLNFEIGFRQGIDLQETGFTIFVAIKFNSKNNVFLVLELGAHFKIEEMAWKAFIDQERKTIIFPKQIVQHFAVIAVGTARGVIHAKTENTLIKGLLLPVIDLTEIITEDVPFDLSEKLK